MRPSLARVRSCVSSIDLPSESTLVLTSETFVLTNPLVAQAVPPIANAAIGTATKNFRHMMESSLPSCRARLPRVITSPGSNSQVLTACADHERMPARSAARLERNEILMSELVDEILCRRLALRRRARHEHMAAGPRRHLTQPTRK